MSSILEGFNYDIFISYRQKDNKGERWVSKFVEALKTELEATFKEDVSVYFDENPHDRLQETHSVDKSLETKLKCLIFIPILSQTYCDPNSYAWKCEFLPFLTLAQSDQFGKNVTLRSGNVATRVLPIRIHDLEQTDIKLFEKETGGVLRSLDFVFKTASGVNRPLNPHEDHPNDNLNKTFYNDQINKAANSIKDIVAGLKCVKPGTSKETNQIQANLSEIDIKEIEIPENSKTFTINRKKYTLLLTAILLATVAIILIPKFLFSGKSRVGKDPDGKISIAVNRFENLTGDTTLNYWSNAIPELLIGNLGTSKELSVQSPLTMVEVYKSLGLTNYSSVVPSLSRDVALKLRTRTYLNGSLLRTGSKIRIQLKLVDTQSDELLWTGKIEGNLSSDFMVLTDSLAILVKNFLEIRAISQNSTRDIKETFTNSPDALRKYNEGMNYFLNSNYSYAISLFQEAFKIDTTFTLAAFYTAYACNNNFNTGYDNKMKEYTDIAYKGRKRLPEVYQIWIEAWNSFYNTANSKEMFSLYRILENYDVKSRYYWFDIGSTYASFKKYNEALMPFKKIEDISAEWGDEWKYLEYYAYYGTVCHFTGDHKKESKLFEKGLTYFPGSYFFYYGQALCELTQGDTAKASKLVDKFIKALKHISFSERGIENILGTLYREANIFDKAEAHYMKALQISPQWKAAMNNLAYMLIFNDIDLERGMAMVKKAVEIYPGDWGLLLTLGTGYNKEKNYEAALTVLQQAKDSLKSINLDVDQQILEVQNALAAKTKSK
jgi:tetratricopeptide (TPR) repeat protein